MYYSPGCDCTRLSAWGSDVKELGWSECSCSEVNIVKQWPSSVRMKSHNWTWIGQARNQSMLDLFAVSAEFYDRLPAVARKIEVREASMRMLRNKTRNYHCNQSQFLPLAEMNDKYIHIWQIYTNICVCVWTIFDMEKSLTNQSHSWPYYHSKIFKIFSVVLAFRGFESGIRNVQIKYLCSLPLHSIHFHKRFRP